MVISELFTEFYTGSAHVSAAKYSYFGLHGKTGLVPWTWTAIVLNLFAAVLFLWPGLLAVNRRPMLVAACLMAFVGAWIEKGMGLIIPGFIPSTLHEIVEYAPSQLEWKVTVGIWAFGLMVFTIAIKAALPTLRQPISDHSSH